MTASIVVANHSHHMICSFQSYYLVGLGTSAKPGAATVDHLIVLKEIIQQIRNKRQTAYIIFLDVQKAYDKAWLDAIMYVMDKAGLKGKNWELTRKLNEDLKATVRTRYGSTREIQIKDSIRQGGVLSVIQYATMIDEIAKELQAQNMGIEVPGIGKLGCLLWMDDVALIHNSPKELQKMLNITNDIAQRYHIEFGAAKCKVVRIGGGKPTKIKLGDSILEETDKYKYLGEVINKKGNSQDHIQAIKGKTNAAYSNIATITGNKEFKGIKMKAIWKLVDTCIIPIMTYGTEGCNHSEKEKETLQQIFNDLLKKILNLPQSTPNTNLLIETGYLPVEYMIDRKKINQAQRVEESKRDSLIKDATKSKENEWMKDLSKILNKYNMNEEDLLLSKYKLKTKIQKQQEEIYKQEIKKEAEEKSKLNHLLEHKQKLTVGTRPNYMDQLTRKQCRAIAQVRTRMIPVKNNMKGSYKDLTCRWCKEKGVEETQEHVLSKCEGDQKINENKINYVTAMSSKDTEELRECANKIIEITNYINEISEQESKNNINQKNKQITNRMELTGIKGY